MSKQEMREEFVYLMAREGFPRYEARLIMSYAGTLHRLAERACNVPLTEASLDRIQQLRTRIKRILKPYKITPRFQDDPRGAVVKLQVPSGVTNDWGRMGICVP